MSPKREAEIWRLVLAKLETWGHSPGSVPPSQPYVCVMLEELVYSGHANRLETEILQRKLMRLLQGSFTLTSWAVYQWLGKEGWPKSFQEVKAILMKRDPHLHNTRIAWVTWLAEQAEARVGGRRGQ